MKMYTMTDGSKLMIDGDGETKVQVGTMEPRSVTPIEAVRLLSQLVDEMLVDEMIRNQLQAVEAVTKLKASGDPMNRRVLADLAQFIEV